MRLAPGQSRPLPFRIEVSNDSDRTISVKVSYTTKGSSNHHSSVVFDHELSMAKLHDSHKITFLHPSQIVSYAVLRAPSRKVVSSESPDQRLSVLLNLHGAGLESDSHQVRHTLDSIPDLRAWVLFPSGVTPWSGDDWRGYRMMLYV